MSADQPPDVRASDTERETAVARLREAAGEGRLSLDDLAGRTEAAYGATTRGEIDQLLTDLPAVPPAPAPAIPRRRFYGILGGDTIRGHMRLAGECRIVNVMGGVDLDLSQATIDQGEVTLRIVSIMGGSKVHVPQGVHVEHSGFSLMGGDNIEADPSGPPPPGAPVVRVRSFNLMGGSDIKRGAPRPWRWPWGRPGHDLGHGHDRHLGH